MFRLNLRLLMSDHGNGLGTTQCDFRLSYCHYSDNMFPSHYLCDNLHPVTKSHEKSCPCSNPTKPLLANHLGYTESRVFMCLCCIVSYLLSCHPTALCTCTVHGYQSSLPLFRFQTWFRVCIIQWLQTTSNIITNADCSDQWTAKSSYVLSFALYPLYSDPWCKLSQVCWNQSISFI